ncbi:hypothetical protein NNA36_02355 [Shimia sp. CNT1-13L.2]|uniref:hypothetical protein n=1 Tax=Shimia sp. CNT1-13L.2 TaxID=2959663 RepID=UPI0020CBC4C7|nr:hypothetical protein [Shimia sp. CNT1-13L.2]MCP9480797.1 hypothetical protein [Shimia sp. CNT1-13L.2]
MSKEHHYKTNSQQCLADLDALLGGADGPITRPLRPSYGEWIGEFFWEPLCEAFGAKLGKLVDRRSLADLRGEERLFLFNRAYLIAKLAEIDDPKIANWLKEIGSLVSQCSEAISSHKLSAAEIEAEAAGGVPVSRQYVDKYGALIRDVTMTIRRYLKKQYAAEMLDALPGVIDEADLPELSELRRRFWTKRSAELRLEEHRGPDIPF